MKSAFPVIALILGIMISSLAGTLYFTNYLYIHPITYMQLAFGICSVLIYYFVITLRKKEIKINLLDLLLLLFSVYLLVRYLTSDEYNFLTDYILFLGILFLSFGIVRYSFSWNKLCRVKLVLYGILFIGLLEAIHGILQLTGVLPDLFNYKLGGAFGNPDDYANFMIIPYVISLGLFFYEKKKIRKWLWAGATLLLLVLIVMSFARTAWIACTVASLAILYCFKFSTFWRHTFTKSGKKRFILFSAFLVFLLVLGTLVAVKLYELKPDSAKGRLFVWNLCLALISKKPIFGHGYQSFFTKLQFARLNYFRLNPDDVKDGLLAGNSVFAFNDFLQWTVEYGLVSLLLLSGIFIRLFSLKNGKIDNSSYLLGILKVVFTALIICMLFSYPMQNRTILFCFFVLLAVASSFDRTVILGFRLKKIYALITGIVLMAFSFFLVFHASQSIRYGLKWKKAYAEIQSGNNKAIAVYDTLFPVLKRDRSFLLNYGSMLYQTHEYKRCIAQFQKYGYLIPYPDMYLMLGDSYKYLKNYSKAEENYKNASYLIPHLFVPKYKLFKLYCLTNQKDKAKTMALQISNMKIKVYSETVRKIKTEINQYLLNNKLKAHHDN